MRGWVDGPDVRRDSSSGFFVKETGGAEDAESADAGMEKPTMEEVGRVFGFEGDAASVRKRDAHNGFGAGLAGGLVVGGSTGCSVGAGTMSG